MKKVAAIILSCLFSAVHAAPELERLDLEIAFVPPHNEPIIGDKAARYRLQIEAEAF